jgi:hypothetical protein
MSRSDANARKQRPLRGIAKKLRERTYCRQRRLRAAPRPVYELLTGALPFTATDPIELIHCHIAREPVPPHELATAAFKLSRRMPRRPA